MATTLKRYAVPESSSITVPNSISDNSAEYGSAAMLDIHQAATLMQCSQTYVAMLIEAEKLPGSTKSASGQCQIPHTSVLQWLNQNVATLSSAAANSDFRKAALEAGMYAIPDEIYLEVAQRISHSDD